MSEKRKNPDTGGSEARKKKKAYYSSKKAKRDGLQAGMRGVIITCVRNKERFCVTEALQLLTQFAEDMLEEQKKSGTARIGEDADDSEGSGESGGEEGEEEANESNEESNDIDFREAFQKEMAELKKKDKDPDEKLVQNVKIDIECVVFIKVHKSLDPVQLVHRILLDAEKTQVSKTRFCTRFSPVEGTCHADLESFEKLSKKVLAKYFHQPEQKPRTFCIQYNTRNHQGGLDREEVIKKLASLVGRPHTVDLQDAELTILVEVSKNVCCMGVVQDYKRFKKYNITSILGKVTASNQPKKNDKKPPPVQEQQAAQPAEEEPKPDSEPKPTEAPAQAEAAGEEQKTDNN